MRRSTKRSPQSGKRTRQRSLEGASFRHRFSKTIAVQQILGAPGQHSSDLSSLALHPWNYHTVVAGRLVGGIQAMTAASARCSTEMRFVRATVPLPTGVAWSLGGQGQPVGETGVAGVEGQELDHRSEEIPDIFQLGFLTPAGMGCLLLGEPFGAHARRSVRLEFVRRLLQVPTPPSGEDLPAFLFLHNPVIPGSLYTAGQGRVTRPQKKPAGRHRQNLASDTSDRIGGRARSECVDVGITVALRVDSLAGCFSENSVRPALSGKPAFGLAEIARWRSATWSWASENNALPKMSPGSI